jgi:hypothetical protein
MDPGRVSARWIHGVAALVYIVLNLSHLKDIVFVMIGIAIVSVVPKTPSVAMRLFQSRDERHRFANQNTTMSWSINNRNEQN